jgi:hypothetical protein
MKYKIAIIASVAVVTSVALASTLVIADSTSSGSAIELDITVKDNEPLTANSFCALVQDWFISEYTNTDKLNTEMCYINTNNETISALGNAGILSRIGMLDKFNGDRQVTNYELCEMLFDIAVGLDKYSDGVMGEQVEGIEQSATEVSFVCQAVGLSDDFKGDEVPTNEKAKKITDAFGEWLTNTEPGIPETVDMESTDDIELAENRDIVQEKNTNTGIQTAAKYKHPESLEEIAENWEMIPVHDAYRSDSKLGFLNLWEGIANPDQAQPDNAEVSDMIITTYPVGSILWYSMDKDQIELSHPMYMNMGYCKERYDTRPPLTTVFTIKDYQVTSKGSLDWTASAIYVDKQAYLEADCLGFVVERVAITNNSEDKGKFTLVVAQIPQFDKSHFE